MNCHLLQGEPSQLSYSSKLNPKEFSYEDALIGKYLDDLRKIESKPRVRTLEISPYLQKLPSSNPTFQNTGSRNTTTSFTMQKIRTNSAIGSRSNSAINIEKFSPYIVPASNRSTSKIINLDDPSFLNSTSNIPNLKLRNRPSSAPIKRSTSKYSIGSQWRTEMEAEIYVLILLQKT
ncbi:hypothetical protein BpHYR1_041647 [Brachionus plicatilis]|uniref:Uncharacterized protein n=1 Tax=Brachionus plicatilis TaxID=10195 RepID=A0A3M7STM4_BRAPC|nr:hypothetical protein BpHYR1_041647 [Brachionus plicatilis]